RRAQRPAIPCAPERPPVFRPLIHLPDPEWNRHPHFAVRRPGILAGHKALVEGTFPMVADGHRGCPDAAGASGAVAAGGRKPRCRSSARMAATERLKDSEKKLSQPPCVPFLTLAH